MKAEPIVTCEGAPSTPSLAAGAVWAITKAVAWVVSLRRPLAGVPLSEDECEEQGIPYGSTVRAVWMVDIANPAPWWSLRVYLHRDDPAEHCIDIRLLGQSAEVWYVPREQVTTAGATAGT